MRSGLAFDPAEAERVREWSISGEDDRSGRAVEPAQGAGVPAGSAKPESRAALKAMVMGRVGRLGSEAGF